MASEAFELDTKYQELLKKIKKIDEYGKELGSLLMYITETDKETDKAKQTFLAEELKKILFKYRGNRFRTSITKNLDHPTNKRKLFIRIYEIFPDIRHNPFAFILNELNINTYETCKALANTSYDLAETIIIVDRLLAIYSQEAMEDLTLLDSIAMRGNNLWAIGNLELKDFESATYKKFELSDYLLKRIIEDIEDYYDNALISELTYSSSEYFYDMNRRQYLKEQCIAHPRIFDVIYANETLRKRIDSFLEFKGVLKEAYNAIHPKEATKTVLVVEDENALVQSGAFIKILDRLAELEKAREEDRAEIKALRAKNRVLEKRVTELEAGKTKFAELAANVGSPIHHTIVRAEEDSLVLHEAMDLSIN